MPSSLGQLTLIVQLDIGDLAGMPAAVFLVAEHGGPEALEVVARFGIYALHFPQEEILQHALIEFLWMLADGFASHCEDGAGLKADRVGVSIVTKVVEKVFKVLRRRLRGSLALELALRRRPLGPAWVILPRNPVPKVEELHGAVREGGDSS